MPTQSCGIPRLHQLSSHAPKLSSIPSLAMDKTNNDKPIFVLCHGAWHPSHLYETLKNALKARGYEILVPKLPTMNVGTPSLTWTDDAATIVETVEPFFAKGRQAISVGHSYGGVPACAATRDNTGAERAARGEEGGFSGLVFQCAFAITERGKIVQQSNSADGLGVDLPWQRNIELPDGVSPLSLPRFKHSSPHMIIPMLRIR